MRHLGTALAAAACAFLTGCGGEGKGAVEPDDVPPVVGGEEETQVEATPDPRPAPAKYEKGRATVEELIEDLLTGFGRRDRDLIASLFPPDALMDEAMVCPGENVFKEGVHEAIEELGEMMDELGQVKIELVEILMRKGKEESFPLGAYVEDGCTAGMDLILKEVPVTARITEGGVTDVDTDEIVVIRIGKDGPWYMVGPD